MDKFATINLCDYSILSCNLEEINFDKQCIINTVNQYSYIIAENDKEFKNALINSDVLLPDGIGIVAAVKFFNNHLIKKIAGSDLHQHLLSKLNSEGGSCFYLGSTKKTLSLIKAKVNKEFSNINVKVHSPPFKKFFSEEENDKIINIINDFKPDVLFVGMTAPKQEKWTYLHKARLNAGIICSIGAVFDFYAGTIDRPSKFWQNLGLEWFVRLLKEPKRMFKRYIYWGPVFLIILVKYKYRRVKSEYRKNLVLKYSQRTAVKTQ